MAERLVPYELGQTAASGELEGLLGYRGTFEDVDRTATGVKPKNSGMTVIAQWVKNESGGALLPGAPVNWDTGGTYGPGQAVAGNAADPERKCAGIVDPDIPVAGVADNDHFWLIKSGPTRVRYDGSANFIVADEFKSDGSGNVDEWVSGTDDENERLGFVIEAKAAGSAGDLFKVLLQIA